MYKKTKQREIVMNYLKNNPSPQTADMIAINLNSEEINLATIYRNLNFFTKIGLVTKSFLNQITYFALKQEKHNHYLICLACNKMEKFDCHLHGIEEGLKKYSFDIVYHDITFYGYCKDCISNNLNYNIDDR
ncbi:MAG: Fur family transcriptional regulator [Bacilli bacterium]|nr:Fur family transcriptional regulator [Bacilli bacterium]